MSDIDPGDIAVGQRWHRVVTDPRFRKTFTVTHIGGDYAILCCDTEETQVDVGTLMSLWLLVGEADPA